MIHRQEDEDIRRDLDEADQQEVDEDVAADVADAQADAVVADGDHHPVDPHDQGDGGHGAAGEQQRQAGCCPCRYGCC